MTGKGRKSSGKGDKGDKEDKEVEDKGDKEDNEDKEDKEDKSSDLAAHGGSANENLGLVASTASTLHLPPKSVNTYVDMKVGSPVLLYNGNLVATTATTSTALYFQTKYTKTVRVPKTIIQEALEANSMDALLALVHYIQDKAGDYGSKVSDAHDLLFLTDKTAPQDLSQAHFAVDTLAKYKPKVVVKVIEHSEGGLSFDIPGRDKSRDPILLSTFLDPNKANITILYSKPSHFALEINKLAVGARGTGTQFTSSLRNAGTTKYLALANYETHMQQGIFSGFKDCLAYTYITGWSTTGRSMEFVGQAAKHIMAVLKRKAGDTDWMKPNAIIALYDNLIKELAIEDLQSIGLSPCRKNSLGQPQGSKTSANPDNNSSIISHRSNSDRSDRRDHRARSRDRSDRRDHRDRSRDRSKDRSDRRDHRDRSRYRSKDRSDRRDRRDRSRYRSRDRSDRRDRRYRSRYHSRDRSDRSRDHSRDRSDRSRDRSRDRSDRRDYRDRSRAEQRLQNRSFQ